MTVQYCLGKTLKEKHGAAYVTGYTGSSDFPITPDAFDTSLNAGDSFVAKLNGADSALEYATK